MITDDSVIGGLVEELQRATEPPEEGAAPPPPAAGSPDDLRDLLEDVRKLGVFGILVAISDAGPPAEEVHREIPGKVAERIRAQFQEDDEKLLADGGKPEPVADMPLHELVKVFHERKGAKSRQVLRKIIENAIYEFYDLKDHALFVDDVGRILDVFKSASGSTDHAQSFMKKLASLSSDTAKFMLGLFPEQINLIYKVSRHEAERTEIDAAFDMFSPRVIWKRVFAILKTLLAKEKRFRLALTVWGRLHGVAISREDMTKLETYLAVKDTKDMVKRAIQRRAERKQLLEFVAAHEKDIRALEESF
jgi:hypothetical protein